MNEKWLVIGYRYVEFVDEKTKRPVKGHTLFLTKDPYNDKVTGKECQKIFISSEYVSYVPELGDEIILLYNKYGKVGAIQVI